MSISAIIDLLERPTGDLTPAIRQITEQASSSDLITALQEARLPLARHIICRILAARCAETAIAALIPLLDDRTPEVRNAAAEALGKIGDPRAGPALLAHFADPESSIGMECMLAAGLGAVGFRPAIPLLVQALKAPNVALRGVAAWGLGILGRAKQTLPCELP